jgi:hypothetical protein
MSPALISPNWFSLKMTFATPFTSFLSQNFISQLADPSYARPLS